MKKLLFLSILFLFVSHSQVFADAEICYCNGSGGWTGLKFWGPKGAYCNGIPTWGTYNKGCKPTSSTEIGRCDGNGSTFDNLYMWGPTDEYCFGISSWGYYGEGDVKFYLDDQGGNNQLCSCLGYGGVNGHVAWGKKGFNCWGVGSSWGTHSNDCRGETTWGN